MKCKILSASILFSAIVLFATINARPQDNSTDRQVLEMLRSFYISYITQNSKEPAPDNLKVGDSIKAKYCTSHLLKEMKKKMDKDELDYDPFLNAQDCDISWLKTLSIVKAPKKENIFIASYVDTYSKANVFVHLKVVKLKGGFKINSVW